MIDSDEFKLRWPVRFSTDQDLLEICSNHLFFRKLSNQSASEPMLIQFRRCSNPLVLMHTQFRRFNQRLHQASQLELLKRTPCQRWRRHAQQISIDSSKVPTSKGPGRKRTQSFSQHVLPPVAHSNHLFLSVPVAAAAIKLNKLPGSSNQPQEAEPR